MKIYPNIPDDLARWAELQPVFFTGTAATHAPHVNISPKGLDAHFAVLSPNQCAYIDRTGSGCETIAHAYENGRLCLMFMSFGTAPRILRIYCRVAVVEWDQPDFFPLVRKIAKGKRDAFDGARSVILGDIWEVTTSCGYGVPRVKKGLYETGKADASDSSPHKSIEEVLHEGPYGGETLTELAVFEERPTLDKFATTKTQNNEMNKYQVTNNANSIDGLPGMRTARREAGQRLWLGDAKARFHRIAAEKEAIATGFLLAVFLYFVFILMREEMIFSLNVRKPLGSTANK